jgi:5-methylcytosine-specific restriction protein A
VSPWAPKRYCLAPRCPNLVESGSRGRCPKHQREYEAQRPTAKERGYATPQWRQLRAVFLSQHPLCGQRHDGSIDKVNSWCARDGLTVAANCVQHVEPPKGPNDPRFLDETNLMASCLRCNNRRRALREPGAFGR